MCLKSEYVYFSQLSGCVLSPCAHILHSLTQAGHNCLMVLTMPSVKKCHMVHHDLAWRCQFLLNCVSWALVTEAPKTQPSWWFIPPELQSSMMLAVLKPEVSLLPDVFLPPPFLKCTGWREIAVMQNICTKRECCATRWNLHSVVVEMALFLSMQGTIPVLLVLLFLFEWLFLWESCSVCWTTFREYKVCSLGLSLLSPQIWSELSHHLRLNLSFSVLLFWVLVLL